MPADWTPSELLDFSIAAMTRFETYPKMPKDEIWLVDDLGRIRKIINIANYLEENSAISLCVGEMK